MQDTINHTDKLHPEFKTVTDELYEFQDSGLRWLVEHGNISEEIYQKIKSLNKSYVPFYRVMDDQLGRKVGGRRPSTSQVL